MTQEELAERIRLHGMHLKGEEGGRWLNLSGEDLRGAKLIGAALRGADLRGVSLSRANLSDADLRGANLRWANLRWANLSGANLSGANLSEANLSDANLSDANLRKADLNGCTGNMSEVKSIQIDVWPVTYTADTLQIGCQRHPIARWREWRDNIEWIRKMHPDAEAWAECHLDLVLEMIDARPATPTGHEEDNK